VQHLDKAFGRFRLALIHLGVLAQHVKVNFAVDDLDEETVDSPPARRALVNLELVSAIWDVNFDVNRQTTMITRRIGCYFRSSRS
jgi:hypothetical protein